VGDLLIDESNGAVTRAGTPIHLTPTELRLLVVLVRNENMIVSKARLLLSVWGDERYPHNIIEQHISRLRHKLEAHGSRMIHTVHRFGYVLRRSD
jgi:DNA-binding response OmpR family regulator